MIQLRQWGLVLFTSPFLHCHSVSVLDQARLAPIEKNGQLFVHIPSHTFHMGRDGNVPLDEQPQHSVVIDQFYIATTEVTNHQFSTFLNQFMLERNKVPTLIGLKGTSSRPTQIIDTGGRFRAAMGWEEHPVSTVTYQIAQEYCRWVGGRLPTEAEWASAARAGQDTAFPWGDELEEERANIQREWVGFMPTTPVAQFEPNLLGLYDVIGNVWEWTETVYGVYEGAHSKGDNVRMVMRGGDWFCTDECTIFTRYPLRPDVRGLMDGAVGFRCVLDVE